MTEKQNNISPILPTYARMNVTFEYGTGSRLYDTDGNEYLDFGSGIAVNCLGHCHPALVKAVKDQAEKLWHTSNIYHIAGQEKLANRLRELTFADSMFFTNSGAEAVECAIKMARRYHDANEQPERYRVITFEGSFHGRTLATIAAGGSEKLTKGFGPKVDGFDVIRFHRDMRNVEEAITHETAAIMIEPIQGEGGIRQVSDDNLQILRDIADEIEESGSVYTYELLERREKPMDKSMAERLNGDAGDAALFLKCRHLSDGEPVLIEERHISLVAVPDAKSAAFAEIPPNRWLLGNVPWSRVEHTIRAINATKRQATLLKISAGDACLQVERSTWMTGQGLTFVQLTYPGNRHQLVGRFSTGQ